MPIGPNSPYSKLDQNQILQRVFEEGEDRLRVDAEVTATVGTVECIIDASSGDNIAIASEDGSKFLTINPDGSINVVGSFTLPSGIATEAKQDVGNSLLTDIDTKLGGTLTIQALTLPLPTGASTEAKQDNQITILNTLDSKFNTLGQKTKAGSVPVVLASDSDPLVIGLPSGASTEAKQDVGNASLDSIDNKLSGTLSVQASSLPLPTGAATEAKQDSQITILTDINSGIPAALGQTTSINSMPVVLASDQSPLAVTATLSDEPVKISGTIDGTPSGTEYGVVYNVRQQILATHDRDQQIIYADFGTKDQRITRIDYSSPTFSGIVARKNINYTLVGNKYRRDSIIWSIV